MQEARPCLSPPPFPLPRPTKVTVFSRHGPGCPPCHRAGQQQWGLDWKLPGSRKPREGGPTSLGGWGSGGANGSCVHMGRRWGGLHFPLREGVLVGGGSPVSKSSVWATTGSVGCWVTGNGAGCFWFLRWGTGAWLSAEDPGGPGSTFFSVLSAPSSEEIESSY